MVKVKRCLFCKKPLRKDGYCENEKCVDYKRTQIHDRNDKKKGN